jgi:gliding-associated putative ABC transporter substrate-binding component GldG
MDPRRRLLLHAWLQALLWLAIALVLNHVSAAAFGRFDLTDDQRFTLSPVARSTMSALERPLIAKVYFTEGLEAPYNNNRAGLIEKLEELRAYSGGRLEIQIEDPTEDQQARQRAETLGIRPIEYHFKSWAKRESKQVFMGVALIYGDRQAAVNPLASPETYEYELVSAIRNLQAKPDDRKMVGYLEGQGEPDLASFPDDNPMGKLRTALQRRYDLVPVTLGADEGVPDTVDVLLVVGPQTQVSDRAQYQIDQFVMRGGAAAFFVGSMRPDFANMRALELRHNLNGLLGSWGIQLNRDLVIDREHNEVFRVPAQSGGRRRMIDVNYPLIPKTRTFNRAHPVSNKLDESVVPFSSSLTLADPLPQGIQAEVLISSGPKSARAKNVRYITPRVFELAVPGEEAGPHPLAAMAAGRFASFFAEKPIPPLPGMKLDDPANPDDPTQKVLDGAPTRLVVVGSADFVANNVPFVLNAVDWLAKDAALLQIRNQVSDRDLIEPPERAQAALWKAGIAGGPLALVLLMGGIGAVLARRRR